MLPGWAAFHQDELMENWLLAEKHQELLPIDLWGEENENVPS